MENYNDIDEVWIYFAGKHPKFVQLYESYKAQRKLINNLGTQLAEEKITRLKNEETINMLGQQLTVNKLNNLKGGI